MRDQKYVRKTALTQSYPFPPSHPPSRRFLGLDDLGRGPLLRNSEQVVLSLRILNCLQVLRRSLEANSALWR